MGVKDLIKLIKKYSPSSITTRKLLEFKGQTWAIDASIYCYKFMYDIKSKKPNNHIAGFYSLIQLLYKNGIRCIVVLDGSAPPIKENTIFFRKETMQNKKNKVAELISEGNNEEADRISKQVITLPPNIYEDIYFLCELMDVPVYRAKYESDYLCSKLYANGIVQGVVSEDTDFIMYRGGNIIRKLSYTDEIEHISYDSILKNLKLTEIEFVNLCIMLGTDFNKPVLTYTNAYIEIQNAQKYISGYENIRDWILSIHSHDNIDGIFNISDIVPDIKWDTLKPILTQKCNFRNDTIDKHKKNFIFPRSSDIHIHIHIPSVTSTSTSTSTPINTHTQLSSSQSSSLPKFKFKFTPNK